MVGKMTERARERRKERKCLRGKEGERGCRPIWGLTHHEAYRGAPLVFMFEVKLRFLLGTLYFLIRKVLIYLRRLTLTSKGEISRCFSPAHFVTARGKAGNRCKLANRSAPSLRPQAISRSLIAELPRGPRGTRAEVFLMTLQQGTDWTTSRLIRLNTRDTPPS